MNEKKIDVAPFAHFEYYIIRISTIVKVYLGDFIAIIIMLTITLDITEVIYKSLTLILN